MESLETHAPGCLKTHQRFVSFLKLIEDSLVFIENCQRKCLSSSHNCVSPFIVGDHSSPKGYQIANHSKISEKLDQRSGFLIYCYHFASIHKIYWITIKMLDYSLQHLMFYLTDLIDTFYYAPVYFFHPNYMPQRKHMFSFMGNTQVFFQIVFFK